MLVIANAHLVPSRRKMILKVQTDAGDAKNIPSAPLLMSETDLILKYKSKPKIINIRANILSLPVTVRLSYKGLSAINTN